MDSQKLNATLRKLNAYRRDPELVREPTLDEMATLIFFFIDQVKAVEKAAKAGELDGYTPQAGKDYPSKAQMTEVITSQVNKEIARLNAINDKQAQQITEALKSIRQPEDGKDGIVSEKEIERAAEMAAVLIDLPDFDAMLAEVIQTDGATLRDALESLPEGEEQLSIEAIRGLRQELSDLASKVGKETLGQFIGGGAAEKRMIQLIGEYSSSLPTQTGNSGKFLTTDGTDASWATLAGGGDMAAATYDPATISEQLVGLTATQTLTNKTLTSPVLNTGISGTAIKDEDNMASDSATHLATQQSIKAYVDANSGGASAINDLTDVTITTPADNEVLAYDGVSAWINQTPTEAGLQSVLTEGAFVDGDKTKLDGIETGADVTDTTNVTAAGALMDSEVTNLAQVKAFDTTDYATAAQGATADSALQDVVDDTTPQLGGNLDVNGNSLVSTANGDITLTPNGTGDVVLGNFTLDADQTVGAGQDNYVLTYDNAGGKISLEAAAGGSGTTNNFNTITIDQTGGTSDTYGVLAGLVNGSNTLYTVSEGVYVSGTLKVYLNGQLQLQGSGEDWVETTPGSGTFTFAIAPATGDEITAEYQSVATSSTDVVYTTTAQSIAGVKTFTDDPVVPAEVYGVGWNGSNEVPTKNDVYDKVETLQAKPSEGAFVDGDKTKLDGIETGADVTDTANVTAAGALMDSEVDADIKTLSLPANTTITASAATVLDDASVGDMATTLGLGTGSSPQFTAVNVGHATDTTVSRVSAGKIAVEGVNVVTTSSTDTLTNKTMIATSNVVMEKSTVASSATPTPTGGSNRNFYTITALAEAATFAAPSGTPVLGNTLIIRIKDNATARALTWNAIYRAIGVTLPTATTISKTMYVTAIYNATDSKWDVLSVNEEA